MSRRLRIIFVLAIIAVLVVAGAAFAYLKASGSGSGSGGTNITVSAVTVTTGTNTQSLLPTGSPTGDLNVTLHNSNSSPVHINSLALDTSQGSGTGFGSNATGCALSFTSQNNAGSGWTIAASSTVSIDLTGSVTMGTTAASSCQGLSFSVYLKAS
jgi:hypothetical protein